MKKILLANCVALFSLAVNAQAPEDILRYSYLPQHGSARNMAIGGAMGSLGGDINALFVNPAGLGLYKTREFALTPAFGFNNNKADYRGTSMTANKSAFDLGTSGLVVGFNSPYSKWTSQAFSIGINQTANFNNVVSYKGVNNLSSFSEQYAEEISAHNINIGGTLNDPRFAYGTYPAIYTYLVDVFKIKNPNGADSISVIQGLPEKILEKGIGLNQEKTVTTKGGIYEVALGYAANMDDKFYVGGSLGIPIVSYNRITSFRESDPSGNTNRDFSYFQHNDTLSTKGFGINARLGIIFKPVEFVRLG
ncbi:MAG: OmpP1/FadL family transporter, partial [Segetibacter sp.]